MTLRDYEKAYYRDMEHRLREFGHGPRLLRLLCLLVLWAVFSIYILSR